MSAQPDLVGDVYRAASTCNQLVRQDLMGMRFIELEAKVTLLLIHLNDLLQKASKLQRRVDFTDAITGENEGKDVTEIIRLARNAACHISSPDNQLVGGSRFAFNSFKGNIPNAFVYEGVSLGCSFSDDMAIYYGTNFVLVKRHLRRAFYEVAERFAPELNELGGIDR